MRVAAATLGVVMHRLALFLAASLLSIATVNSAESQITSIPPVQPTISIPGRGPDAIGQARQRALAPVPQAPGLPAPPSDQWVPERHVFSTEYQREIIIPGHYESRVTGQQSTVPTLPGYGTRGELPVVIPGGDRPPADQRTGL
jgi:hypothetical protein